MQIPEKELKTFFADGRDGDELLEHFECLRFEEWTDVVVEANRVHSLLFCDLKMEIGNGSVTPWFNASVAAAGYNTALIQVAQLLGVHFDDLAHVVERYFETDRPNLGFFKFEQLIKENFNERKS